MSQKIIEYHMNRLKDKRAEIRIQSIQELVLLKAFEALDTLREIYETDADTEVRKAAQVAGRELFMLQRASKADKDE